MEDEKFRKGGGALTVDLSENNVERADNGQDVGQALDYDAAFGFTRTGAQSFYFFEQDGLVQISYGGQVLPNLYDQVFHNRCCEAAIHNVETGPDAVWFHALREGIWHWVEASLDEGAE